MLRGDFMPKKILVVDDEADLVETLKFRLEAAGYAVVAAYDGQEGLAMAKKEKPNLILLDVMMPKLDGFQVCRLLKFDSNLKNIPIIMLTARGQDQDKLTGKGVGADIYITKPFDAPKLMAEIKKFLGE